MIKQSFLSSEGQTTKIELTSAGYTIVELLVVLAIMTILAGIVSITMSNYASRQSLNSIHQEVIDGIQNARRNTLASLNDTTYGVYVGTSSIAFFEGSSYSSSDPNNEYIQYTGKISATSSLSGGSWSVVFNRLNGEPSAYGTIVLTDISSQAQATVTIAATGLVE